MDEMAWCETSIIFENVNGECELGFAQIKHLFHDFSTVAVVLAAPALPSRLCRVWPRINGMALYEATIIFRDVNGACGPRFAQNQQLYSLFGRSPHCRCGRAPPSGIYLKRQQMDDMA